MGWNFCGFVEVCFLDNFFFFFVVRLDEWGTEGREFSEFDPFPVGSMWFLL